MARATAKVAAVMLAVASLGAGVAACGSDDVDGDAAAFCERLDRLIGNDPFAAFGDTATPDEIEIGFDALRQRAGELVDVAPPEARPAAEDYRDAVVDLDEVLAGADYRPDVDPGAYRNPHAAYVAASDRLMRYHDAQCAEPD